MKLCAFFCGFFLQVEKIFTILFAKFIPSRSASEYCTLGFFGNNFRKFILYAVYFSFGHFVKVCTDLLLKTIEFF